MASPQWEDGYSKIANEILEALARARLAGEELRITLYILRMTYGYGRKECKLSYGEIGNATGIDRRRVHRIIKTKLSPYRVIGVAFQGDRRKQVFNFNKDYDQWEIKRPKKSVTLQGDSTVTLQGDRRKFTPLYKRKKEITLKFAKKTPIPKKIFLNNEMVKFANSKGVFKNLKDIFEEFRDWHLKNNSKHADWLATWRSWIRNHIKFNGRDKVEQKELTTDNLDDIYANP